MTGLGGLEPHWWWLLGAALLGILEIFFPGVFLIWMAAAAAVTGIAVALVPLPIAIQMLLFALLAAGAVFAGRRYYERNPVPSSDPMLNDRTARLVGQRVTVVKAIANGEGRVRVGDSVWAASGPDAEEGATMVVTGAHGTCLDVAAVPPPREIEDKR
jgi:membrane protein implicated in regulation of membrane protease activity